MEGRELRRALAMLTLTLCLAGGSGFAAEQGRTVEREYQPVEADASFPQGGVHSRSSVTFRVRAHETSVTVAIQDDSGLVVPGEVRQDRDGDGESDLVREFCGSTSDPIAIEPGVAVTVVRMHGWCDELTNPTQYGSWTTGTVTATFAR